MVATVDTTGRSNVIALLPLLTAAAPRGALLFPAGAQQTKTPSPLWDDGDRGATHLRAVTCRSGRCPRHLYEAQSSLLDDALGLDNGAPTVDAY